MREREREKERESERERQKQRQADRQRPKTEGGRRKCDLSLSHTPTYHLVP